MYCTTTTTDADADAQLLLGGWGGVHDALSVAPWAVARNSHAHVGDLVHSARSEAFLAYFGPPFACVRLRSVCGVAAASCS